MTSPVPANPAPVTQPQPTYFTDEEQHLEVAGQQPVDEIEAAYQGCLQATKPEDETLLLGSKVSKQKRTRFEEYELLFNENQLPFERELVIPIRRICGFGLFDSVYNTELTKKARFIEDQEIIRVHPMRFLRNSPFAGKVNLQLELYPKELHDTIWDSSFDSLNKQLHAIGCTEDGRHVILQQAIKSCVPSCIGMLALDHSRPLDHEAIRTVSCASLERAVEWVTGSGLTPVVLLTRPPEHVAQMLQEAIQKDGSGMLSIIHPELGGHAIVLDEISTATHSAVIRDSFHGWSLTIRLDSLLSWVNQSSYFLQARAL